MAVEADFLALFTEGTARAGDVFGCFRVSAAPATGGCRDVGDSCCVEEGVKPDFFRDNLSVQ